MPTLEDNNCNPFWKSVGSRMKKFLGRPGGTFYVVYPPLDNAEDIRNNPEKHDPSTWLREDETYAWFHEANAVAEKANKHAGVYVAIVCEVTDVA